MENFSFDNFPQNIKPYNGTQGTLIPTNQNRTPQNSSVLENSPVNDTFLKKDASNDGKFTIKEALKNFGKGLVSPLTAIIKNPLPAVGILAATFVACSLVPVLAPVMAVGFGALSVFQLGKGILNAVGEYKKGNYDNSERSFQDIGTGFVGTALTALGIKQTAKIAAEAKAMSRLGTTVLSAEQKFEIATQTSKGSWLSALKENITLFTTKEGLGAMANQFKPSMLKARLYDIKNTITNKKVEKKEPVKTRKAADAIEEFKKTPEGVRRAKLSNAEVKQEAQTLFDKAFDELGIPKEHRPKLVVEEDVLRYMSKENIEAEITKIVENYGSTEKVRIFSDIDDPMQMSAEDLKTKVLNAVDEHCKKTGTTLTSDKKSRLEYLLQESSTTKGGSYSKGKNELTLNATSYRNGVFEIDDVIMHEATHCKEALLRAGLPQDKVDALTKEVLLDRIRNGESEQILKNGGFMGAETMEPPKMSAKMKNEFADLAQDTLYTKDGTLGTELDNYSRYKSLAKSKSTAPKDVAGYQDKADKAAQSLSTLVEKLKKMINDNPDFSAQYGTPEEALDALMDYSLSHNVRYKHFSNVSVHEVKDLPQLTPEQTQQAIESFRDNIASTEGNARISGFRIFGDDKGFNQYQFSPEEVLAQQEGNKFLIKNITEKIREMKHSGTLTAEQEAYLTSVAQKAKLVIEYKTKGLKYYEAYTKALHQPNNTELLSSLKTMEKELKALKAQISPQEIQEVIEFITMMARPDFASVAIPLNTAGALGVAAKQ